MKKKILALLTATGLILSSIPTVFASAAAVSDDNLKARFIEAYENFSTALSEITDLFDSGIISTDMIGDLTQDGVVDSLDASLALEIYGQISVGIKVIDESTRCLGDTNLDGTVDASDASGLLAYYSYVQTYPMEKLSEMLEVAEYFFFEYFPEMWDDELYETCLQILFAYLFGASDPTEDYVLHRAEFDRAAEIIFGMYDRGEVEIGSYWEVNDEMSAIYDIIGTYPEIIEENTVIFATGFALTHIYGIAITRNGVNPEVSVAEIGEGDYWQFDRINEIAYTFIFYWQDAFNNAD